MTPLSSYIIKTTLGIGVVSVVYFFGLCLHCPLWVIWLLSGLSVLTIFTIIKNKTVNPIGWTEERTGVLLVLACVFLGTVIHIFLGRKYGDWDAVSIWNFNALYLSDPRHWQELYSITYFSHTDYPHYISAFVAMFWRTFQGHSDVIPFALASFFTLAVPTVLVRELMKYGKSFALFSALLWFSCPTFINIGLIQCADIPLAFLFLGVLIVFGEWVKNHDRHSALLLGLLLGACLWMKNEGALYVLVFLIVNVKVLFKGKAWLPLLLGMMPFLLAWLVLKVGYAPQSDLMEGQTASELMHKMLDKTRYKLIAFHFLSTLKGHLLGISILATFYFFFLILIKKKPARQLLLVLGVLCGFAMVYLLTPHNLEWHLTYSVGRLFFQMVPAIIFIILSDLARYKIITVETQNPNL